MRASFVVEIDATAHIGNAQSRSKMGTAPEGTSRHSHQHAVERVLFSASNRDAEQAVATSAELLPPYPGDINEDML